VVTAAPPIRTQTRSPLVLWHLLSLDAPTVAALWTWFVAAAVHVYLPIGAPAAMALAVWMLYAADRLLDSLQHDQELEARHRFHHKHRPAFLTGIAIDSVLLSGLLYHMLPGARRLYALLGSMLFAWFLLIHARGLPGRDAHRLPKEIAVGICFPAAVFIPTVARFPALRLPLLPHATLFAAVCSLNCLFIYAWEHPDARPRAHWTTRYATRHLTAFTAAVLIAAITIAAMTGIKHKGPWPLALACALSALALLALNRYRSRIQPITLRAAADLALLTPLLFLPFLKLPFLKP